jgi:putative Holliday junction resolvase
VIVNRFPEFLAMLSLTARLLSLDVGKRTIGLAVSDAERKVASSVGTLRRTRLHIDVEKVFQCADERTVSGLIIGLPINMDGSESRRCYSVRQFANDLLAIRDIPLMFWDERLSTVIVERAMIAADLSRSKRAKQINAAAAAWILQGVLDAINVKYTEESSFV